MVVYIYICMRRTYGLPYISICSNANDCVGLERERDGHAVADFTPKQWGGGGACEHL